MAAPAHWQKIPWWMSMLSSVMTRCIFGVVVILMLLAIPYRMSYYSRSDSFGRALAAVGYRRIIPGTTGWVWLGRYETTQQRWIEGPSFALDGDSFRPSAPPQDGTVIVLTRSSRIMVHGWQNGAGSTDHFETICYAYDQDRDDTGQRLPPGARVVVRAAPLNCTFGDGEIACAGAD